MSTDVLTSEGRDTSMSLGKMGKEKLVRCAHRDDLARGENQVRDVGREMSQQQTLREMTPSASFHCPAASFDNTDLLT